MPWIDLGDPEIRTESDQYSAYEWMLDEKKQLSKPQDLETQEFHKVVLTRRSRRTFGNIPDGNLSELFWMSCHAKEIGPNSLGFPLSKRPLPSSGAIHSVHVLLNFPSNKSWWIYQPFEHALYKLRDNHACMEEIRPTVNELVSSKDATIMFFVAEPGKAFSKYNNASSLIWRDAGVLIGHLALVAESLKLNFCPLGITGDNYIKDLDRKLRLHGVGFALLGSSTTS